MEQLHQFSAWLQQLSKRNKLLLIVGGLVLCLVGGIALGRVTLTQPRQTSTAVTAETKSKNTATTASSSSPTTSTATSATEQASSTSSTVVVDVKGAVKRPGVYQLAANSRVQAALATAGGVTDKADVSAINLAEIVADQAVIYVPKKEEKTAATTATSPQTSNQTASNSGTSTAASGAKTTTKVKLNSATKEELMQLTGIGEKKAEQIIAYREQIGQFSQIEQIKEVSGIGDKTFETIKDQLDL